MANEKEYSIRELSEALTKICEARLCSQLEISEATGIEQSTISKAKNGYLKRKSAKTDRLMKHSQALLKGPRMNKVTDRLMNIFYSNGGTLEELNAIIEHGSNLISRKLANGDGSVRPPDLDPCPDGRDAVENYGG